MKHRLSKHRLSKCGLSLMFLLFILPSPLTAQIGIYQQGAVVRMHMGDCVLAPRGFMMAFGGPSGPAGQEACPEYTLVSNRVVFLIVGKSSNQLIPLADSIDFRLQKNEIAVRIDDAKHEAKFTIKEMMVRSEWDRLQRHIEERMRTSEDHDPER
ncbi:MAG: hypothetical protein WAK89_00530 [Candidatus Sulfotelmatobacter sp.]